MLHCTIGYLRWSSFSMAVKHRFLNERSGTMFNSNRPKLTVLQSD
jgi:hypothetical protein